MSKRNRGRTRHQGGAPRAERVGTASLAGFDQHIHALGHIPLDVNRALPLIERGDLDQGSSLLQDSLVKVELAKACILGNLAFAAMKAGDNESALGYLSVAVDSLKDLGLEDNEISQMLTLAHIQLSGAFKPATEAAATAPDGKPAASTEPSDSGKSDDTADGA